MPILRATTSPSDWPNARSRCLLAQVIPSRATAPTGRATAGWRSLPGPRITRRWKDPAPGPGSRGPGPAVMHARIFPACPVTTKIARPALLTCDEDSSLAIHSARRCLLCVVPVVAGAALVNEVCPGRALAGGLGSRMRIRGRLVGAGLRVWERCLARDRVRVPAVFPVRAARTEVMPPFIGEFRTGAGGLRLGPGNSRCACWAGTVASPACQA
jgi:hypothetical protein